MGFSDRQMRALSRSVPSRNVRTRVSAGKELIYIEGWYALAQANRIFGFDGWDREMVETKCVQQRESRGYCTVVYSARVRITVRAGDMIITRDGHGTGEAHGDSAGEVHDRALKAAETDATKRALATFGKAFGLALYSGHHRPKPKRNAGQQHDEPRSNGAALPSDHDRQPAAHPTADAVTDRPDLPETDGHDHGTAPEQVSAKGPELRQRIEKSALTFSEAQRIRDKEHLRFVASQPCLLCNAQPCDAHHLRFSQPRALGRKVGDEHTVPLCRRHHRDLHQTGNEAAWWHDMGIDALEVARQLWRKTEERRGPL